MSVLFGEETRLFERSGSARVALGAAHDWQPLEPKRIRHLLRLDLDRAVPWNPGAFTPLQNGKPMSIAQMREIA
jgi:hypothetical protein